MFTSHFYHNFWTHGRIGLLMENTTDNVSWSTPGAFSPQAPGKTHSVTWITTHMYTKRNLPRFMAHLQAFQKHPSWRKNRGLIPRQTPVNDPPGDFFTTHKYNTWFFVRIYYYIWTFRKPKSWRSNRGKMWRQIPWKKDPREWPPGDFFTTHKYNTWIFARIYYCI